jgi:hypothetical protein
MRSSAHAPILIAMRINALDTTLTNGHYELPRSARGVLVLADPPEAGWRLQPPANEPATADCNRSPLRVPAYSIPPTE